MRENLSKEFRQIVSNVPAIRSMSMESKFSEKFALDLERTYIGGRKAAPSAGLALALGGALTYIAEGLMFYVGAVLMVKGGYSFGQMVQVFTLIIFSVTFSGQIMGFLPAMAKSLRAAIDFWRLLELSAETRESEGRMTFPIEGRSVFDKVSFAYPQRPDVPVLMGISFEIKAGECVGIVGASGSGKSTLTTLLQHLYEPDSGAVLLDGRRLPRTDVRFLRDHIAIVSQHRALFDMTVAEKIAYGCDIIDEDAVIRAAKAANVHELISSLPKGYQTMLGENASLISGGQAQRLQIARALLHPREILILDECTSALDAANQAAVMETISEVKKGKTTIFVTHKLAVMETCDRLLVMMDGAVMEQCSVAELKAAGGVFAQLASGGEWETS